MNSSETVRPWLEAQTRHELGNDSPPTRFIRDRPTIHTTPLHSLTSSRQAPCPMKNDHRPTRNSILTSININDTPAGDEGTQDGRRRIQRSLPNANRTPAPRPSTALSTTISALFGLTGRSGSSTAPSCSNTFMLEGSIFRLR